MKKAVDKNTIGYRIRMARVGLNLTQKQLANEVNIVPTYLTAVERGNKNASEDLIERIADATHTTKEWLLGTSGSQTTYPEPNIAMPQTIDNTASVGYLAEMIGDACARKGWTFHPPKDVSLFPKTDWQPDFWLYSEDADSPIRRWAFDLSLSIYKQPDLFGDGTLSPRVAYLNFLSNLVFGNPAIRNTTKYTFVVPSIEIFDSLCKPPVINLGNASIMLIDISRKTVIQEFTLCATEQWADFLENQLHF